MSLKSDAIILLNRIACMLELLGEDRFRVAAHQRAARSLEAFPGDLETIIDNPKALQEIPGIGKKVAEKLAELHQTGRIAEYDQLAEKVPAGLLEVLEVPGLGPKTVKSMWEMCGVVCIDDLNRIIADGTILTLPRMGQKAVEKIKASLSFVGTSSERLPLGLALPIAERFVQHMRQLKTVTNAAYAGSLRRGRETVGDIDILITAKDPAKAAEHFRTTPGVASVIAAGETKSSVRYMLSGDLGRWGKGQSREVQVDLRIVPAESWGAALMYFTGSKEHNVRLRERALKQQLTLNEYGLFPLDDDGSPPQKRGVKPVAAASEQAIYQKLGMPFIPPEIREAHHEFALAQTPELITAQHIKAELHAHTTASDGKLSLDELVHAAIARGFHTIAVTDHSKSSVQARGLTVERLRQQRDEIQRAREKFGNNITILHGSEVDILSDGSLDFDDQTLAWLDIVVASPHAALGQEPAIATTRLLKAISHPAVHILGHPTGRLLGRRKGLEPAIDELVAAAVEHDTALEINTHWLRLDLRDAHARAAVNAGAKIAIDSDVHRLQDFDNLRYGIATARRGWVTPKHCINAMPATKLHKWLKTKRK